MIKSACRCIRRILPAVAMLAISACVGCLQIETTVSYQEDGSAVITERVNFSRKLLDMASAEGSGAQLQLLPLLQKEAALERMKSMGKGITLVSHKMQDGLKGSKESLTVFKIADLNDFTYISPWMAYRDYSENNAIKWNVVPMYKSRAYGGGSAGEIAIELRHVKGGPKGDPDKTPEPEVPPASAQVYREISPVFRDILQDFQLKLTFEGYAPVYYGLNSRGQRSMVKSVDIINVTDKDLDKYGYNFFENEEIMLDLVRWELGAADVVDHVKDYSANATLPVFSPLGSRHGGWHGYGHIHLRASKTLFDRHFTGKKLDFSEWGASTPDKHQDADFAKHGYRPEPGKKDEPEKKDEPAGKDAASAPADKPAKYPRRPGITSTFQRPRAGRPARRRNSAAARYPARSPGRPACHPGSPRRLTAPEGPAP